MNATQAQNPRGHQARSGSALLIVIGTLALIAVFAAIYITIGQGDRRSAATVRERNNAQEIQNTIAGHIAGVIARDRLDVYPQHLDATGTAVVHYREITDAPFTDWTVRSESSNEYELFNSSGRHTDTSSEPGPSALNDYRVAYDAWLASTRPTYLGSTTGRVFSAITGDPQTNRLKEFLDNRDWLQISNLAEDGRFVSLFNLRPQQAFGARGGFKAEPGIGFTNFDGQNIRRMSEGLSLLKPLTPGDPESPIQAHVDGFWLPGNDFPVGTLDPNIPAHWTMYQRYMLIPLDQPSLLYDRNGALADWSSPDYAPYQYADTDGDGFADARWFELTSAREPHGTSSTPRTDIKRLYDNSEFRVFAAARVVDLSSMVNVNVATDGLLAPTSEHPFGSTPADVDLRRLLSMQDAARMFARQTNPSSMNLTVPLNYSGLHRPTIYRQTGSNPFERSEADYVQYQQGYITPPSLPIVGSALDLNPESHAVMIGRYAYDALRMGINREFALTNDYYGRDYFDLGTQPQLLEDLVQYPRDPLFTAYPGKPDMITADIRVDQFEKIARIDPSKPNYGGYQEFGAGLYGMDDLSELLTYHSINDPAVTTRLEAVLSGRLENADNKQQDRLSPLLSNRPLELDRFRHGQVKDGAAGNNPNRPRIVNGMIAEESMTLRALSPRGLMTAISGAVGLRPSTIVSVLAGRPGKLETNEAQALLSGTSDATTRFGMYSKALAGELSSAYQVGGIRDAIWVSDLAQRRLDATAAPYATLFYGHRGPEFAYRVAAHAAVNVVDLADNDDTPTIATFVLAADPTATRTRVEDLVEAVNDNTIDYTSMTADTMEAMRFPGIVAGNVLEVPAANVPTSLDTDSNMQHRRLVNVIGVEPMPVISEVASMYVYTDAPEAAGGDRDYTPIPGAGGGIPLSTRKVTISRTPDPSNPDLMMQLFAVQLTNPFDEPINLGGLGNGARMGRKGNIPSGFGGNTNNFEFLYYLEYQGRFYKLGEYREYNPPIALGGTDFTADGGPPEDTAIDPTSQQAFAYFDTTLQPGESRVFYALAHGGRFDGAFGTTDYDQRWFECMNAYTGDLPANYGTGGADGFAWTGLAEEWVQGVLTGRNAPAVHMHQFNPIDGSLVEQTLAVNDLFTAPAPIAGITRPASETASQVRLWRKYAVPSYEEAEIQSLPTNATRRNLIENDILIDRFELSSATSLSVPMNPAPQNGAIPNTVSFPENTNGYSVAIDRNDNTGLSVIRWKTERRLDSSGYDQTRFARVEPWLISSRRNTTSTRKVHADTDVIPGIPSPDASDFFYPDGGALDDPSIEVREKDDLELRASLRRVYDDARVSQNRPRVLQTIALHPDQKSQIGAGGFDSTGNNSSSKFPSETLSGQIAGDTLYSGNGPKPELFSNNLWSVKRVADLLLTTGIGITYAPDPDRNVDQTVVESDWITFPEAMAIALGYEQPVAADNTQADSIWWDAVLASGPGGAKEYALQDLHLSIDNYVAYIDGNSDQRYTPNGNDIRRGTGAPIALGVIDMARPIGWLDQLGDQGLTPEEQNLLALTRPTFGTINVNTAPVEVLRLVPGLTPSMESYRDDSMLVQEWWANRSGFSGANLPDLNTVDETPDIAAGLVSYRDRMTANARIESYDSATPFGYTPNNVQSALVDRNMIDEASGTNDRVTLTGINGLRGSTGFGSLGELLAVTLDPSSTLVGTSAQLTMGYYGLDGKALGTAGVDTDNDGSDDDYASMDLQVFGTKSNPKPGVIDDDYAEQLAVANGVLNTLSVRSDYFAVWFVVQGFRESDVSNLGVNDPLVPSFKKRYLMVVDRTNVVKDGQQPRILLLKEVPL
ncbi:MAG: hypothetical protein KC996_09905 [Phycisphaerales bacterium]|nr:hypothetical protein [Phycisphaerales bacterium]